MESKYNDKIISWSKIATVFFIILVILADILGVTSARYIATEWAGKTDELSIGMFTTVYYLITVLALIVLICVFKLLQNMSRDVVFDKRNTDLIKYVVICLIVAGFAFFALAFVWGEAGVLSLTAWFVSLIVLSVKVAFDKAITMKKDIDLTI
ncbi:MAG: DUF2975 domain-containing protein [Clostridiales bacterium]|nr:DUF2975 domain-containing protein [Clostridiales bacterium]